MGGLLGQEHCKALLEKAIVYSGDINLLKSDRFHNEKLQTSIPRCNI